MTRSTRSSLAAAALLAAGFPRALSAQAVGQADVQIQALSVTWQSSTSRVGSLTTTRTLTRNLQIGVTVFSNNDDDAQAVRLLIFLPPESQALTLPSSCAAGATNGTTGTANAYVTCRIGTLPVNGSQTIAITASAPPSYVVPRVGVFAWSDTSDPNTANNHAEAVAP